MSRHPLGMSIDVFSDYLGILIYIFTIHEVDDSSFKGLNLNKMPFLEGI
jgi:hypothetical protein